MTTPDLRPGLLLEARKPIGVFDSGLGGLTVVHALAERVPGEHVAYLGDTARVPYGSKSAATVARYSLMSGRFLLGKDVKLLVVACNTASAFAIDVLRAELPVPVLGVVEPGAEEALRATSAGRIGVIGTLGTVRSGSYARAIAARDPHAHVTALACPLFVPLVEEGWLGEGEGARSGAAAELRATQSAIDRYLGELHQLDPSLDVLVLGCTHYPLLRPLLAASVERLWRHPVALVDSAQAMARAVEEELRTRGLLAPAAAPGAATRGDLDCYVTDETRFAELGARFLGHALLSVERVDLA